VNLFGMKDCVGVIVNTLNLFRKINNGLNLDQKLMQYMAKPKLK
jgi:hypothetical protein